MLFSKLYTRAVMESSPVDVSLILIDLNTINKWFLSCIPSFGRVYSLHLKSPAHYGWAEWGGRKSTSFFTWNGGRPWQIVPVPI